MFRKAVKGKKRGGGFCGRKVGERGKHGALKRQEGHPSAPLRETRPAPQGLTQSSHRPQHRTRAAGSAGLTRLGTQQAPGREPALPGAGLQQRPFYASTLSRGHRRLISQESERRSRGSRSVGPAHAGSKSRLVPQDAEALSLQGSEKGWAPLP